MELNRAVAENIKRIRKTQKLSLERTAAEAGVSRSMLGQIERGEANPPVAILGKLAAALKVSVKFLTDDDCTDPLADIEKDTYVEQARALYGAKGVRDMNELLDENRALFAGGSISEEQKDAYFQAIMAAYLACKEEAKKKFGRKTAE